MKKTIALILVLLLALSLTGCKSSDYKEAMSYYADGKYEAACELFKKLGNYEDSIEMVNRCIYAMAEEKLETKQYSEAADLFESLGDYEDSSEMVKECNYQLAHLLIAAKEYDKAREIFGELGDYQDSATYFQSMKWHIFANYISEQGSVVIKNDNPEYTVTLTLSDGYIQADYVCSFSDATALFMWDNPYAALAGHIVIKMGTYHVEDTASTLWDISSYKTGDAVEWDELDHYHSGMNAFGKYTGVDNSPLLSESVTHAMTSRISESLQRALTESGLNITMANIGFTNY